MRNLKLALISLCLGVCAGLSAQTPPDVRTGVYRGKPITFQVIDGWAVVEGDIILGRAQDLEGGATSKRKYSLSIASSASVLWPKVANVYTVPYTNDNANTAVEEAVKRFNATFPNVIQFVKRNATNPENDFVQFVVTDDGSDGCSSSSNVGRVGGAQQIKGSGGFSTCVPVLMHEMGHSIGLYHEQQRSDRDSFVQVMYGNVTSRSNYDRQLSSVDLGLYDLGSTMHYGNATLAADASDVTMVSIPVGIPFKEGGGFSAGDIDGVLRLYGAAPSAAVTITTNPPGLQFTVDDQPVTSGTPNAVFKWSVNDMQTTHTLDVPDNLKTQTLNGYTYVFGRWSDVAPDQPVRHTITVAPGDGSALYPATSPRFTVYEANFQQLVPSAGTITTAVFPDGKGQIVLSPDPITVQGTPSYYITQPLSAQATPILGFNFYDWQLDGATPLISGANPRIVRPAMQFYSNTGTPIPRSLTARFAMNPVTTVTTNPPGLQVTVDSMQFAGPKNFAQDYDASWIQGSSHSIAVTSPQASKIADAKARLAFTGWSDGGAATHNITAGSTVFTANFAYQFPLNVSVANTPDGSNCPATFTQNPASADTFYNSGTQVSLTIQPGTGWNFIGWLGDLTGNANPGTLTLNATKNVQAVLNTTTDPLSVTGITPAAGPLNGTAAVTVTINGTGFTNSTQVCLIPQNGAGPCAVATFTSSNQIQAQVTTDLLTAAQAYTVRVSNSPDGQCSVAANTTFTVQ